MMYALISMVWATKIKYSKWNIFSMKCFRYNTYIRRLVDCFNTKCVLQTNYLFYYWFWYLFCHRRVASLWVLRCWGWCIDSMRGTWSGRMLSPQSKENPHSLTTSILVINFIVVCCCRSQHWRQKFVDLALIWMEVFAKQINKWVVTAVAQDQVCQFEIHTCT